MAVFIKNFAKSLTTNVLPTGVEKKLPNLTDVTRQMRENANESQGIFSNLKSRTSELRSAMSGLGSIHKTAYSQLKSGKFGISPEQAAADQMKAMGFDFDMSGLDGDFSSSDSGEGGEESSSIHKTYVVNAGDGGATAGAVAATGAITAHGLASMSKIMSNMANNIALMNAFHREKTAAYYEMSLEALKAIVQQQDQYMKDAAKMFQHFNDLQDSKNMRQAMKGFDPAAMLNPLAALKDFGAEGTTSGMMLGMLTNGVSNVAKDPLGTLSSMLLFGSMFNTGAIDKMFGPQIKKIERFAGNLPYKLQRKFESWSAGRDYSGNLNLKNFLATIGDALKMDLSQSKVKVNQDAQGAVAFDARTRRAIITEIPGYLAMIHSEIRSGNAMFSQVHNVKAPNMGNRIYDNEKGYFVNDKDLRKSVRGDIRRLETGGQYGGLGHSVSSVSRAAGIGQMDAGRLQAHLTRLANSNVAGSVDFGNADNLLSLIVDTHGQGLQRKKGESDADFRKRVEASKARVQKQMSGSVKKLVDARKLASDPSFTRQTFESEFQAKRADALRAAMKANQDPKKALAEIEKEYKKELKALNEGKRGGGEAFSNLEDSFLRHKYDVASKRDEWGRFNEGTANEKVAGLDSRLIQGRSQKEYTNNLQFTKKDALEKMKGMAGAAGSEVRNVFDRVKDGFKGVWDKMKEWASKGVEWSKKFWIGSVKPMMDGAKKTFADKVVNPVKNFAVNKVLNPFKGWLLGTDKEKAAKVPFKTAIMQGWNRHVLMPVKTWFMGGDKATAKKLTFFQTMKIAMDEKVFKPVKGWLFGKDGEKKSFVQNFGDWMGPRVNRLLFGADKAGKKGLWDNIKGSFKAAGDWIQKSVFSPLKSWFKDELMPSVKDLFGEVKIVGQKMWTSVKTFFTKDLVKGAKGIMNEILGEKTIDKIRKAVVDPFSKAIDKLTSGLGNVLRFFLRLPVNFFKGIADFMKLNRMKKGEGNFSDDEKARLDALDKRGSTFDFMRGVKKAKEEAKEGFEKVGEAAAEGFQEGLADKKEGIAAKSVEQAQDAVEGVKKALEINSPSKVLERIGAWAAEGFSLGMKSKAKAISDAWARLRGEEASNSASKGSQDPMAGGMTKIANTIAKNTKDEVTESEKHTELLTQISNTLTTIKDMGIPGGSGVVTGNASFLKNPLVWIEQKLAWSLGKARDLFTNTMGFLSNAFNKTLDMVKDLPKTTITMVGNLMKGIVDQFGGLPKMIFNGVKGAFNKILDVSMKVLDKGANIFMNVLDKGTKLISDLGGKLIKSMKPFMEGLGKFTSHLAKGLAPVFSKIADVATKLADSFVNLTKTLLDFGMKLGRSALRAGNRLVARMMGYKAGGGDLGGEGGGVFVMNWRDAIGSRKKDPLYVYVVDGQIATYPKKQRKGFGFTDNKESIGGLAGAVDALRGKKKDEKKDDSIIPEGLKDLAISAGGEILGRAAGKLGGKAGGLVSRLFGKKGAEVAGGAVASRAGMSAEALARSKGFLGGAGAQAGTQAAGKAGGGVLSKIGAGLSKGNAMLSGIGSKIGAKALNPKNLTIGGLVALGAELILGETAGEDSWMTMAAGAAGNMMTGASLGAFGGPIGMIAGAVLGLVFSPVKKMLKGFTGWIEKTFDKEINSLTTSFLEFPDKLTAWLDDLPNKVDKWTESLPDKIMRIFDPPAPEDLDPNTGLPKEERPSILWKMMKALGNAGITLVKNAPRIGLTMLEAMTKAFMAFTWTAIGFLGKGTMRIGHWIGDTFDDLVHGLGNSLASTEFTIFGKTFKPFSMFGETKEETEKRIADRERSHRDDLQKMDDGTKSLIQSTNGVISKGFDPMKSVAKGLAGSNDNTTRDQNRYTQAFNAANGDEQLAKEKFAKMFLNMSDEQVAQAKKDGSLEAKVKEGGWDSGKASYAQEDAKVMEDRYKRYVQENRLVDNDATRAQFAKLVESERDIRKSGNIKNFGTPEVQEALVLASKTHGIPLDLMTRVGIIESGLNPSASNPSGAKGLFQFMPATAKEFGIAGQELNPYANADAAARFMVKNKSFLERAGIPVNATTMYLAHQQGPQGILNVWKAATGKGDLSEGDLKRMGPNDPFGEGKARRAADFIAGWQQKIEGTNTMFPQINATAAKTDARILAMNSGSALPVGAKTTAMAANDSNYAQPQTPAARANSGLPSAASTEAPKATLVASNGAPVASSPASANNAQAVTAQQAGAQSAAEVSRNAEVAAAASSAAVQSGKSTDDPLLAELRRQTELLAAIVSNTHGMTDEMKNTLLSSFKEQSDAVKEAADKRRLAQRGKQAMFGDFAGEDVLRPSANAIRLASGMNIPDSNRFVA
jgi:hypothetical protein